MSGTALPHHPGIHNSVLTGPLQPVLPTRADQAKSTQDKLVLCALRVKATTLITVHTAWLSSLLTPPTSSLCFNCTGPLTAGQTRVHQLSTFAQAVPTAWNVLSPDLQMALRLPPSPPSHLCSLLTCSVRPLGSSCLNTENSLPETLNPNFLIYFSFALTSSKCTTFLFSLLTVCLPHKNISSMLGEFFNCLRHPTAPEQP